jgi:hypothetical protein
MATTTTPRQSRIIARQRLAMMLTFTHQHLWEAQRAYALDRVMAWEAMQDRMLDLWNQ